jgi:hypothetical protein
LRLGRIDANDGLAREIERRVGPAGAAQGQGRRAAKIFD